MSLAGVVSAYARAWARHVGLPEEGIPREVERRFARLEPWARLYAAASAGFVLWAAPLVVLGRPRSFRALTAAQKEELLARLLAAPPPLRSLFFGARALALAACYRADDA